MRARHRGRTPTARCCVFASGTDAPRPHEFDEREHPAPVSRRQGPGELRCLVALLASGTGRARAPTTWTTSEQRLLGLAGRSLRAPRRPPPPAESSRAALPVGGASPAVALLGLLGRGPSPTKPPTFVVAQSAPWRCPCWSPGLWGWQAPWRRGRRQPTVASGTNVSRRGESSEELPPPRSRRSTARGGARRTARRAATRNSAADAATAPTGGAAIDKQVKTVPDSIPHPNVAWPQ